MEWSQKNALVIGGSRGIGRGMALALVAAGAETTVVARDSEALNELKDMRMNPVAGDATDPTLAGQLLDRFEPDIVVLTAGATPLMRPLSQYDWESFTMPWNLDVKITFHLLRESLLRPLHPDARVVVLSSGAALGGSPLSGGYASAKQAQRFLCSYARQEIRQRELGFRVHCILPSLNPNTRLGEVGVRGYARAAGMTPEQYVKEKLPPPPTPESAGRALLDLLTEDAHKNLEEALLTARGLKPISN